MNNYDLYNLALKILRYLYFAIYTIFGLCMFVYYFSVVHRLIKRLPDHERKRFFSLRYYFKPDYSIFELHDINKIKATLLSSKIVIIAGILEPIIKFICYRLLS